jgi:hypothetical protein
MSKSNSSYICAVYGGYLKLGTTFIISAISPEKPEDEYVKYVQYYGENIKGHHVKTDDPSATLAKLVEYANTNNIIRTNNLYEIGIKDATKLLRDLAGVKKANTWKFKVDSEEDKPDLSDAASGDERKEKPKKAARAPRKKAVTASEIVNANAASAEAEPEAKPAKKPTKPRGKKTAIIDAEEKIVPQSAVPVPVIPEPVVQAAPEKSSPAKKSSKKPKAEAGDKKPAKIVRSPKKKTPVISEKLEIENITSDNASPDEDN